MIRNKTSSPKDFKLTRFYCIIFLNWIIFCSRLNSSRHSNRPLPQQPQEPPRHSGNQSGAGDYASLTRYREKPSSKKLCFINPLYANEYSWANPEWGVVAGAPDLPGKSH